MKIKVLGRMVAVERAKAEEKTKGGIILTERSRENPCEGTVIAIGKDVTEIKLGDKVLFAKYGGMDITAPDGNETQIFDQKDILAIL